MALHYHYIYLYQTHGVTYTGLLHNSGLIAGSVYQNKNKLTFNF